MNLLQKPFAAALVISAVTASAGCGSRLSGLYVDQNDIISVEFKSGKAYLGGPMGGKMEVDYELDGDSVILKTVRGNMVLGRNKDGSLDGPTGTLVKRAS